MKCRHCHSQVSLPLIDLGSAPPSNAYLTPISLRRPEKWFPLKVVICQSCWLVQAEAYSRAAELFKQAADKGYSPAQYNLALLHIEGQDASPSLSNAAKLMKAAAD